MNASADQRAGPSAHRPAKPPKGARRKHASGESPHPSTLHDADDALDAGVDAEEKGERFAVGPKALRRYQEAVALYLRALQLRPDWADAAYNAARVYYLLATSFYPPPANLVALRRALGLYRRALRLAPPPVLHDQPGSAPPESVEHAFTLDVSYNLGVALQSYAEALQELDARSSDAAHHALRCAAQQLHATAHAQEVVLHRQRRMEADVALMSAAYTTSNQHTQSVAGASSSPKSAIPPDTAMRGPGEEDTAEPDGDEGDDGDDEDERGSAEFVSSVVTPASAVETLASLHSVLLTLLETSKDLGAAQELVRLLAATRGRAEAIAAAFPDAEQRSEEGQWAEATHEMRLAALNAKVQEAVRTAHLLAPLTARSATAVVWPAPESAEDAALHALEAEVATAAKAALAPGAGSQDSGATTASQRERAARRHVQWLCELGDASFALAKLRARQLRLVEGSGASDGGGGVTGQSRAEPWCEAASSRAWQSASDASKLFLAALSLLGDGAAAISTNTAAVVVGQTATSTPTTRSRSAIHVSLAQLALFRAAAPACHDSPFAGRAPRLSPKTRQTLADNARVYARRALSEVGLGWATMTTTSTRSTHQADSHALPPGGWESVRDEAEAMWTCARAVWKRIRLRSSLAAEARGSGSMVGDEGGEGGGAELGEMASAVREAEAEMEALTDAARRLVRRSEGFDTEALASAVTAMAPAPLGEAIVASARVGLAWQLAFDLQRLEMLRATPPADPTTTSTASAPLLATPTSLVRVAEAASAEMGRAGPDGYAGAVRFEARPALTPLERLFSECEPVAARTTATVDSSPFSPPPSTQRPHGADAETDEWALELGFWQQWAATLVKP